jgi:hypothetical protein
MSIIFTSSKGIIHQIPTNLLIHSRLISVLKEIDDDTDENTQHIDTQLPITKNEFQETHEYLIRLNLLKTVINKLNSLTITNETSAFIFDTLKTDLQNLTKPHKSNIFYSWLDIDDQYEQFLLKIHKENLNHNPTDICQVVLTSFSTRDAYISSYFHNNLNVFRYLFYFETRKLNFSFISGSIPDILIYFYHTLDNDVTKFLKENTPIEETYKMYQLKNINPTMLYDSLFYKSIVRNSIYNSLTGNLREIVDWIIEKEGLYLKEDVSMTETMGLKIINLMEKQYGEELIENLTWISDRFPKVLEYEFIEHSFNSKTKWLREAVFSGNIKGIEWILNFKPTKDVVKPFLELEMKRGYNYNTLELFYNYCDISEQENYELFYITYRFGNIGYAEWLFKNKKIEKENIDRTKMKSEENDKYDFYGFSKIYSIDKCIEHLAKRIKDFENWLALI